MYKHLKKLNIYWMLAVVLLEKICLSQIDTCSVKTNGMYAILYIDEL